MTANIHDRIADIREKILRACERSGRSPADVTIVAVSKGAKKEEVLEAKNAGILIFAENRIQEAQQKVPEVPATWHLVGHLQSNKVKTALELFQVIESVDSVRIARAINDEAAILNRVVEVFLEVNISGEDRKYGFKPEEIYSGADEIKQLSNIRVTGLMGIAAHSGDPEVVRACFKKLKGLFGVCKSFKSDRFEMKNLSMGMSGDYEIAVEEGATHLRLGRAIFGERAS